MHGFRGFDRARGRKGRPYPCENANRAPPTVCVVGSESTAGAREAKTPYFMRIALISGTFLPSVGGLEWKVHFLATEYARRGHDAVVITARPPWTVRTPAMPFVPLYRIERVGVTVPGMGRLGILGALFRKRIARLHRLAPFDVLHCHHLGMPTRWGVQAGKRLGVPVVATTCGEDVMVLPELGYGDRLQPKLDECVRMNVREAAVVGSVSSAVRADLEGMGATARIIDIPNGVDWDLFQIDRQDVLRRRFGWPASSVIILSLGRHHFLKNYDMGLDAFSRVVKAGGNARYVLAGRGATQLAGRVQGLGLTGVVALMEQVPMAEVPALLKSADVFFNPSRMEGFAQVNAQALAAGLPLVITDAPGNVDAAAHGGAVVARSGDVEDMGVKLGELVADAGRRERLGRQAHEAGRHFSWSSIAEAYLEIFRSLQGRGRPSAA